MSPSRVLLLTLADATRDGLAQYSPAMEALRSRVRNLARSADLRERASALQLVAEARNEGYPRLPELHDEAARATGSAEWNSSGTPGAFRDAYLRALHASVAEDGPDLWPTTMSELWEAAVRSTDAR